MTPEEKLDLIHRELDGEVTVEERGQLEALLASDADARAMYESVRAVVQSLSALENEEPPATLASDIIREFRTRGTRSTGTQPTLIAQSSHDAETNLSQPRDQHSDRPAVVPFDNGNHTSTTRTTKERTMNSRKRIGILGGFGAVAAALAVFFFAWPPESKDNHAASGAIGAVQKHREQQITRSDVILGDEASRKEENVVYADFLGDAAKLSNISAQLNSMFMAKSDIGNRELAMKELANIEASLANHEIALEQRTLANADQALASIEQLLAARGSDLESRELANVTAQLESMKLNSREMANRVPASQSLDNKSLANRSLENKSLSNRELAVFAQELASMVNQLESRGLFASMENVSKSLESANRDLENRSLEAKSLDNVKKSLDMAEQQLQAASSLQNRAIGNRDNYLEAMILEHQAIEVASKQLGSDSQGELNVSAQLENVASQLESVSSQLESRALANMESRMESRNLEAKSLDQISASLESMKTSLSSRQMESRSLQNIQQELASMEQALSNVESQLEQKMLGQMQAELAAIGSHIESRSQLQSQFSAALESRKMESRSLGVFQNHLESVSSALESRSLQNRQLDNVSKTLAVQARELENKSKNLGVRGNE